MDIPSEIRQWRQMHRTELLARRNAVPALQRRIWTKAITRLLVEQFPVLQGMLLGTYCPFNGEFDPRAAMRLLRRCGTRNALPTVVQKKQPLQFREWWPGAPMSKDECDIPVPDGTEVVRPEAMLIPAVGFDSRGFRLGYGGGYFDRTLAASVPQPLKIGVAFELSRMATIRPQRHDVPMDFIVTEAGVHYVFDAGLELVSAPSRTFQLACEIVWRRDCGERRDRATRYDCNDGPERMIAGHFSSPPCYAHEIDPFYKDD
ncbi:MAG: 5-formyltetrahydrofolate cyclo-ligase [Betaproteobacteria bacterium]|jgi:5-formyltetrahydrofolate cyclo-ligase